MASAGDIHSILYRGDILKQPVPKFDPSKRVQRHFPGKAPEYSVAGRDEAISSESEEAEDYGAHHRQQVPTPSQLDTSVQDRRLQMLRVLSSGEVEVKSEDEVKEGPRVVKRRRIVQTAQVLHVGGDKRDVVEPVVLRGGDEQEDSRAARRRYALELRKKEEEEDAAAKIAEKVEESEFSEEQSSESDDEEGDEALASVRPVFVPAAMRLLQKEQVLLQAKEEEEEERKKQEEAEERRKDSKKLLAETITREEDEQKRREDEAARGTWNPEDMPDDDDDGVNEEAEYELWRIREMKRILRDKEEEAVRLEEEAHIERRRHMTDTERRLDDKRLDALRPKSDDKRKYKFMQKYYHKGAFFQDLARTGEEPLYLRDFNVPVGEDAVDKHLLPAPMKLRRGQFGKAGQVKHTHLADVDTTDFSAAWAQQSNYQKTQSKMAGYKGAAQLDRPSRKKDKIGQQQHQHQEEHQHRRRRK